MWHDTRVSKPFYRRAWFRALAVLAVICIVVALVGFIYLRLTFIAKAKELDFSKLEDMEIASIVYDRHGEILGKIYIQNRDTVPISEMPQQLIDALISAEDNRFYQHPGVDVMGIARAVIKDVKAGRARQGASTITQQLARNSFPDAMPASDRSLRRKLLEAFVAMRIEDSYSKRHILEMYLNRVYFGSGFYGVEAAAHGYFGKSTRELTLSEAAVLTGMLRSPNNLSPWRNRKATVDVRNFVLGRMLELGYITQPQYDAALAEQLAVKNRRPIHGVSYAVEFVRQQVADLIGDNESVYGDGYRIYTTLDATLQRTAENSIRTRLEEVERRAEFGTNRQTYAQYQRLYRERNKRAENDPLPGPSYLQGALIAMDNATGGVLALVGGRNFIHNQFNRALRSNRPAGTAFLPLVYAAAFEKGIFPGALFQDAVMDNRQVMIGGTTGVLGEWGPEREDNQFEGAISAHDALVKSKNAATVRLGMATGLDAVIDLAQRAGIDSPLRPFPATFLGSSEVTLEDLTLSYTLFPNGGVRSPRPFVVEKVVQKDGKVVYERPPAAPMAVIRDSSAYEVHAALADSLEWGSAEKAYSRWKLKKAPLGGKTGTAYNFTDVWFVGYSSAVTCGVWAGFDSPQPIYRGGFSSDIALPIWVDFMNTALERSPAKPLHRPGTLSKHEICRSSGELATPQCMETRQDATTGQVIELRTVYNEWATTEQAPKHLCSVHGEAGRNYIKEMAPSEGVRAQLAINLDAFTPVRMQQPTVLGEDPYQAVRNTTVRAAEPVNPGVIREPVPEETPAAPPAPESDEPQVRRAEPVRTLDVPDDTATIRLDAPPAIEF